jgi:hypothetical protein
MATKTDNPHGQFYSLLAKMKGQSKDNLVWKYSNMLTTSLSEFQEKKPEDYRRMIGDMQKIVNATTDKTPATAYQAERELKKKRSAILHRLQKYGIDTTDWNVVNKFMRNPKIAGKTLGEMSVDEMNLLIPKLESILAKDKVDRIKKVTQLCIFSRN